MLRWVVILGVGAVVAVLSWLLLSVIMLLRDYDDIDWGDDEF